MDHFECAASDALRRRVAPEARHRAAHVAHAHVGPVNPDHVATVVEQRAEALLAFAQRPLGVAQHQQLTDQIQAGNQQCAGERRRRSQPQELRGWLVAPGECYVDDREQQHGDERHHRRPARALPVARHGRQSRGGRRTAETQRQQADPDEGQRPGQIVETRVVGPGDVVAKRLVGDPAAELQQQEGGREPRVERPPRRLGVAQRPQDRRQQREAAEVEQERGPGLVDRGLAQLQVDVGHLVVQVEHRGQDHGHVDRLQQGADVAPVGPHHEGD